MARQRPRILYVDDSNSAFLIQEHLVRQGFDVELAENPEQAEKKFGKQQFDLVISDIYFDSTQDKGIKFIGDQVRLGRRVLVTSAIELSDFKEFIKMELPFLEKPFTFEEADKFIDKILSSPSHEVHFDPEKFKSLIISHTDDPWTKSVKKRLSESGELTVPEKRRLMLEIELEQLRKEIRQAPGNNRGHKELNELVAKYIAIRREVYEHNGWVKPRQEPRKISQRELVHRPNIPKLK